MSFVTYFSPTLTEFFKQILILLFISYLRKNKYQPARRQEANTKEEKSDVQYLRRCIKFRPKKKLEHG